MHDFIHSASLASHTLRLTLPLSAKGVACETSIALYGGGGGGATGQMPHLVGGAIGVALSHADMTYLTSSAGLTANCFTTLSKVFSRNLQVYNASELVS